MGSFLIVSAPTPYLARQARERALPAAVSLNLGAPAIHDDGPVQVVLFPPLAKPALPLAHRPDSPFWVATAGAPICRGAAPPALNALLTAEYDAPGALLESDLDHLEGLFALFCGLTGSPSVWIVTDRLGSFHVYQAALGDALVLSNSALLLASLTRPALDSAAARHFLNTGSVFGGRSLFEGVRKLPAASVFECSNGALRFVRRHWDIATKFHGAGPPPPSVGDTARSLVEAMDAISAAYPHPLVDLTGGYDSRLVFAAMLETGRPFTAIVNGPANSRDVMVAKSVASAFAVPLLHGERPDLAADEAWSRAAATIPLTDGEFDALLYFNTMQVHRSSAERFSASVNGSNGEITKGYWYELLFPHTGRTGHFDPRRIAAKRFVFDLEPSPILAARFDLSLVDEFAAFLDAANRDIIHLPNTALLDNAYLSLRMQYWQGRIASSTLRIWPVTSPFFFRRPMELAMATPGTVRLRLGLTTRLIEALNPRLAAMPLEHGYPAQPIRPSNAHRFVVPLIQEYWPKVRQRLPFPPARVHGAPELSLPARLATLPAVRSLLDFDSMASATLYNPDVFRPWLQACLTPGAPSSLHRLGRVLTIELAARAAARFHS